MDPAFFVRAAARRIAALSLSGDGLDQFARVEVALPPISDSASLQGAPDEIHARQRGRFYQTLRGRIRGLKEALEAERAKRTRLEQIGDTLKGGLNSNFT